jgi:hypothetical protein
MSEDKDEQNEPKEQQETSAGELSRDELQKVTGGAAHEPVVKAPPPPTPQPLPYPN